MIDNNQFSNQEIEDKLCSLPENEMSKRILLPLFEKLYSGSAHFTGGTLEKGRDILINCVDELDEKQYIAVQVKKIKLSSNTQHTNSLQQLLIQLSQASIEPIIDAVSGCPVIANKLIFVTPYSIPQSTLDSHQTYYRKVIDEYKCKVIDGSKLVLLIKKHRPDLLSQLFEVTHVVASSIKGKLNNKQLMKALDMHISRDVSDIYCDISFFFGRDKSGNGRGFKIIAKNKESNI